VTDRVRVTDLRIHLGRGGDRIRAVDGVSFTVADNEILAIVGESGSGKTVTSRALLGMTPPDAEVSGSVVVDGHDVLSASPAELRRLRGSSAAMVFQEPSTALNPVFPIGWQVEEGLRAHGLRNRAERRRRAMDVLRTVGIPDPDRRYHDYPHQFSGGQKQRIVIAMALALEPAVIIADEPTTALDVTVQAEILDVLRACRDELGTAIVLVTHNMGVVADLADRVLVMREGRVVESADSVTLFSEPGHDYTRRLLAAVPRLLTAPSDAVPAADTPTDLGPLAVSALDVEVCYPGRFRKPGFRAVRGVSFHVGRSEVLGLVGESGSGKSTIGRALIGLAPITTGTLTVLGTDVATASTAELRRLRRRVGFIFQDPASSFNPFMTVAECIAEPLRIQVEGIDADEIRRRVAELVDAVRLPASSVGRSTTELSGGQRQRVGIARALVLRPELVIADEPTSALDVSVQASVLELLRELRAELGFAALFITHDLAVVEQFADRIGVLRSGELVETAAADELLTRPTDDYTRALVAAVPVPDPVEQRRRRLSRRDVAGLR
jgi:peptide/nickel transport system ATP-binding protein